MDHTDSTSDTSVSARSSEASPEAVDKPSEQITSLEGIPALSLDAISSVAYGPEAMLVVLASAGAGALAKIEPITVAIVVLLVILVSSYRQVIRAYPDGAAATPCPRPTSVTGPACWRGRRSSSTTCSPWRCRSPRGSPPWCRPSRGSPPTASPSPSAGWRC